MLFGRGLLFCGFVVGVNIHKFRDAARSGGLGSGMADSSRVILGYQGQVTEQYLDAEGRYE